MLDVAVPTRTRAGEVTERAITKSNRKNEGSKVWKAVVKGWDESIRLSREYKMNFSIN